MRASTRHAAGSTSLTWGPARSLSSTLADRGWWPRSRPSPRCTAFWPFRRSGACTRPRRGPTRLFVSDEAGGTDTVIDVRANRVVQEIALGGDAGNTEYDSVSYRVFVAVQT